MPLTGALGSAQSQPGWVQPGYVCTGQANWQGPFVAHVALVPGLGLTVAPGQTIAVTPAVASQLAQSDLSWWVLH